MLPRQITAAYRRQLPTIISSGHKKPKRGIGIAGSANLGQQLEAHISDLIKTDRYNPRSEVLRNGILLIDDPEKRLAALDIAIEQGVADADAGRSKPIHDVAQRLTAKYQKNGGRAGEPT